MGTTMVKITTTNYKVMYMDELVWLLEYAHDRLYESKEKISKAYIRLTEISFDKKDTNTTTNLEIKEVYQHIETAHSFVMEALNHFNFIAQAIDRKERIKTLKEPIEVIIDNARNALNKLKDARKLIDELELNGVCFDRETKDNIDWALIYIFWAINTLKGVLEEMSRFT